MAGLHLSVGCAQAMLASLPLCALVQPPPNPFCAIRPQFGAYFIPNRHSKADDQDDSQHDDDPLPHGRSVPSQDQRGKSVHLDDHLDETMRRRPFSATWQWLERPLPDAY